MLAGPNGSGKSTIQKELRPEWIGVFINADEIEKSLKDSSGVLDLGRLGITGKGAAVLKHFERHLSRSQFARKLGLDALVGKLKVDKDLRLHVPGPHDSYLASVLADAIRRELLTEGRTFTFETVMSSPDKIEFMKQARACGYRVYLYFVATDDPEINLDRVKRRVLQGGHPVPEVKVRKRYRESIDLLAEACRAAHRTYIFDNSGSRHKLLAEMEELEDEVSIKVHASLLNPWFIKTALWRSFS